MLSNDSQIMCPLMTAQVMSCIFCMENVKKIIRESLFLKSEQGNVIKKKSICKHFEADH